MTPRGKRHACRPLARETWTCAARGLILCLLVFSLPVASGQQVSLPPVNLGDTNFLDGVAGPGLLVEETFEYYHGYRLTGPRGHKLPGDNSLGSLLSSTHVAYLTELKILGGYYGVEAVVPVAFLDVDTDLGLRGSRVGVGDLSLSPFMLQWTDQTLFGMSYLHRLDLVVILPTGRYSRDSTVNVGSNVFSLNPYYAFTLFLTPRLETSWRVHYLWTSENTDPNPVFQAGSVQPGQAVHFNAALSYEVWPGVRAGVAGYYLKQITDARIDGHSVPDSKEQVGAIGPGLLVSGKGLSLYLNAFFEVGAENRPQGTKLVWRLSKAF
jgi:hypothetical protein